jgi:hypothetical protein
MLPDWLITGISPYQIIQRNGYSLEEMISLHLPIENLNELRYLGFLLLRPDCLLHNEAADILEFLEDIVLIELKVIRIDASLFDALYRFKLQYFGENIWLHHRIFNSGPSAVVLVAGSPQELNCLSERINNIKGPSSAIQAGQTSHLRSQYKRVSSFHAVVHSSEDIGAFLYESTLFFPWSSLRDAIEHISTERSLDFS